MKQRKREGRVKKKIKDIFTWLVLFLVFITILYMIGVLYPGNQRKPSDYPNSDWMSHINGELKLSEINIPGTHDSGAQYIFPSYILRNQNSSIEEQLLNGYRYLDIRVSLWRKGGLRITHDVGTCREAKSFYSTPLTFEKIVETSLDFLAYHSDETIIMAVKPENSDDDITALTELIEDAISKNPDKWYTDNKIPTLNEARGKIVLARRYDGKSGISFPWSDQGSEEVLSNPLSMDYINESEKIFVQDRYHYEFEDKWDAVLYSMNNCPAGRDALALNFLSASVGTIPHPFTFAKKINERFLELKLDKGKQYGIIIFDFGTPEEAAKIIETN